MDCDKVQADSHRQGETGIGLSGTRQLSDAIGAQGAAVRRFLFGMCGDWDLAEDIAQDSLLKAWKNRLHFDGRSALQTWVFAIARNRWVDFTRKGRARPPQQNMDDCQQVAPVASPQVQAAREELARAVGRALDNLPFDQREALALRESDGLTFDQIAQVLGIPVSTAKSRVRYALLKLAGELEHLRTELEE